MEQPKRSASPFFHSFGALAAEALVPFPRRGDALATGGPAQLVHRESRCRGRRGVPVGRLQDGPLVPSGVAAPRRSCGNCDGASSPQARKHRGRSQGPVAARCLRITAAAPHGCTALRPFAATPTALFQASDTAFGKSDWRSGLNVPHASNTRCFIQSRTATSTDCNLA